MSSKSLVWAFDLDGVITANPAAMAWLTYHLHKKGNRCHIYILTWRDGQNQRRREDTIKDLERFGISYDELIMASEHYTNTQQAAKWKVEMIEKLMVDIWFDDEIKSWQRDWAIPIDALLPEVAAIWI